MQRLHLVVSGRVQGVFYRASAAEEARRLGVAGWIRNRADGSVEITAEGPADKLAELFEWCKHGPPGALVREWKAARQNGTGEFRRFSVLADQLEN
ncbi:MAG: acylphosphatase [Candidatus Eremiobacteraeota bacterium]|nr:acylphosphatase [Candidatus Eremiobacteraeota bacterium]MBC5828025.1 acylphosphatase [Candidatus Eremiobacteraeota bacterium]